MKIVYIGANGMLGRDVQAVASRQGVEFTGLDLPQIDITNKMDVKNTLPDCDVVINGAAYTRVDDAEKEITTARIINADGAGNVAEVCREKNIKLIHISTDYVFNGKKGTDYIESDPTDPLSVYGMTKWQGEVMVRNSGARALIVRAQSLYGIHGRNFVKAILNQVIAGKKELTVVSDQVSSPTYTMHLGEALLNCAGLDKTGILHVASRDSCSWYQFAVEIIRLLNVRDVQVKPMPSSNLNYPAPRPAYSVLSTDLYTEWTGSLMPTWRDGLKAYLQEEPLARQLV
ncbi:MAG TPA: dTDP-4-dehydrorhamnose reductase [Kiritimatiellia bacterium]|nr:dTDP-4-dehydrorhamnose reductase [Kiritimatiellia bacterium]